VGDVVKPIVEAKAAQQVAAAGVPSPGTAMVPVMLPGGVPGMAPAGFQPSGPLPGQPWMMGAQGAPGVEVPPDNEGGDDDEDEDTPPVIDLPLSAQKSARMALRRLIATLKGRQEGEWLTLVAQAISNEPTVYHYAKAVSMRRALVEAGASDDLATRVIILARDSGLVPGDMRYE
jgi:hypothetical protein